MIEYNYESNFKLENEEVFNIWISKIVESENKLCGELCFIFCDDAYLLDLNRKHLQHDTYTDIITFDYCVGDELNGDIFISTERVAENANYFNVSLDNELKRVMAHGILHLCGYKDKSDSEKFTMRQKEDAKTLLF